MCVFLYCQGVFKSQVRQCVLLKRVSACQPETRLRVEERKKRGYKVPLLYKRNPVRSMQANSEWIRIDRR